MSRIADISTRTVAHGVRPVAVPAISCGIYACPVPAAAQIAVDTTIAFLAGDETLTEIIFTCFGQNVSKVDR